MLQLRNEVEKEQVRTRPCIFDGERDAICNRTEKDIALAKPARLED